MVNIIVHWNDLASILICILVRYRDHYLEFRNLLEFPVFHFRSSLVKGGNNEDNVMEIALNCSSHTREEIRVPVFENINQRKTYAPLNI